MLPFVTALKRSRLARRGVKLAGLWVIAWYGLPWTLDLPDSLNEAPLPGRIYKASDGTPLRHMLNDKGERAGEEVKFEQLPKPLVDALLAAEDHRFFQHGGVDAIAVCRALGQNLLKQRITSGASTITQQLIKISSPPSARTLLAKAREALLARQLEMRWTKAQIFAAYANRVSFGNLFTGCATACEGYFHKPLSDLTDAEAAFLAALPQAPGRMNPFRDLKPAISRQKQIITQLDELGWLRGEALEIAKSQPVRLQRFRGGFVAPHAIGLLEATTTAKSGEVHTTIDARWQKQVEAIIANRLEGLRDKHVEHAAAVVIENQTGRVLALAGSRDFFADHGGQINGAWAPHSPGSALKPFTYALAFERGFTPASIVADLPVEFQTNTGLYRPENYDHRFYGPMTLRYALGNSLNISAVRVLRDAGGAARLQDLLQSAGLTTLTEPTEHYGLGLTIGNAPVRLLELANAYAMLARLGIYKPWTLLADDTPQPPGRRCLNEHACWWIADILSDNNARMITFGPRSPLKLPFRVAAKTGTSTNYRDNFCLGFTPEFTVGVWAGNFEGQPMDDVSGVTGAGPIFHDIFLALNDRKRLTWFESPADMQRLRFDPRNGKLLTATSPPARLTRDEAFFGKELPRAATKDDYEHGTGRALLSREFADWVKSKDNWLGDLVTCDGSSTRAALRITNPTDGLVIRLNPDVPGDQQLVLRASPGDGVTWQCPTLTLRREGNQTFAILIKGQHVITARHGDEEARSQIRVE